MRIIDFNSSSFRGFPNEEKILVDTGMIYAYYNRYDAYHQTVKDFFDTYVFGNDESVVFLFVNPTIINEIVNLAQKPLQQYLKAYPHETANFTEADIVAVRDTIMANVRDLIKDDVINVIDGTRDSALLQIDITNTLGAADAVNASIAHLYSLSFLTVDKRLVNNMKTVRSQISNIDSVYYTEPKHREYFT